MFLDELHTKLDPKDEKCIFIKYFLEQKGYKCYNPATQKLNGRRDVVFYEMSSWYKPVNVIDDVDAQNGNAA